MPTPTPPTLVEILIKIHRVLNRLALELEWNSEALDSLAEASSLLQDAVASAKSLMEQQA